MTIIQFPYIIQSEFENNFQEINTRPQANVSWSYGIHCQIQIG